MLDEIEARALHDVVLGIVSSGDDFFGDTERGANFGARKFSIFEKLQIAAGELRLDNVGGVPKQQGFVGGAGAAFAFAQGGP